MTAAGTTANGTTATGRAANGTAAAGSAPDSGPTNGTTAHGASAHRTTVTAAPAPAVPSPSAAASGAPAAPASGGPPLAGRPAREVHGGVRAVARIVARADGRGGTALPVLDGVGPLAPRRTRAAGSEARVMLVGAMSGPLGGDRFAVGTQVGEGARLHLGSTAATIALPGQTGDPARYDVRLDVADDAELHWLPEQLISAAGSDLRVTTRVELTAGARLVLREEQVLGRTGEEPGRLASRIVLRIGGRTVLDQELSCGPGAPGGWDGPAVLAGHRAVGQLVVARPEFVQSPPAARTLGECAVLAPLAGPAVLVTALAPDGLRLRKVLDEALAVLT